MGRPKRGTTTSLGSNNWLQAYAGDIIDGSDTVGHDHKGRDDDGRHQRLQDKEHQILELPCQARKP